MEMQRVNISCGGYSVATRYQIKVYAQVLYDIDSLARELCRRLATTTPRGDATMIEPGDTYCTYIVTYAKEDLEEPILETLAEIEADVIKAVDHERLRRLVKNG